MEIKCPQIPLFSPERKTIGYLPCIMHPGHAQAYYLASVAPALMLSGTPEGLIRLWTFLHMDGKSSGLFEMNIDARALPELWREWEASPEHFAVKHFGWWPRAETALRVKPYVPNKEIDFDLDFKL